MHSNFLRCPFRFGCITYATSGIGDAMAKYVIGEYSPQRITELVSHQDCQVVVGVTDVQFIHANGLDMGDDAQKRRLSQAQSRIQELVVGW
ncbi:hypothetical protein [Leptolyngbya sp. FACHB-261]|uniref:hypothetical protein n=1 Tax=Leptolyngbya sp. FACHB-261 TaxID=2692806 RepID=UPI00168882F2|nr:hypothetical protein [Leptolyngbya sp. FACHB-261]MBD2104089.1 hypothetical protein [Leptolyngbya sp. FACHB-261]